jgi:hypothetical protein
MTLVHKKEHYKCDIYIFQTNIFFFSQQRAGMLLVILSTRILLGC